MEVNVLLSVTIVPVLIVILNIIVFDEAVYYEIFLPGYIDDWIFSQSGNFFCKYLKKTKSDREGRAVSLHKYVHIVSRTRTWPPLSPHSHH